MEVGRGGADLDDSVMMLMWWQRRSRDLLGGEDLFYYHSPWGGDDVRGEKDTEENHGSSSSGDKGDHKAGESHKGTQALRLLDLTATYIYGEHLQQFGISTCYPTKFAKSIKIFLQQLLISTC